MQREAITLIGTTGISVPDLSWIYTHLAILLLECLTWKGNCNAFIIYLCTEMLTCLPAVSCCSADFLHHSLLVHISLFDTSQQQS